MAKSKYAWLKPGTKVRWPDNVFARTLTHGTFVAFGYSVRKAWVKRKSDGEQRFVDTFRLKPIRSPRV